MKVYIVVFENDGWQPIGGVFSTEQKAYNFLWDVLDRFPSQRWDIEEREVQ